MAARKVRGVTDVDVATFTESACNVLADQISKRTGWPVVLVADGPNGVVGSVHAGVRTPDGLVVDVEGCHTEADWLDRWAVDVDTFGGEIPGYDPDLVNVYTLDQMGYADMADAARRPGVVARAAELAAQLTPACECFTPDPFGRHGHACPLYNGD